MQAGKALFNTNLGHQSSDDDPPSERSPTRSCIKTSSVTQAFIRRHRSAAGERQGGRRGSRDEERAGKHGGGSPRRRAAGDEVRKDPEEGGIEKIFIFQDGAKRKEPCKDLKEKLLSVTVALQMLGWCVCEGAGLQRWRGRGK